MSDIVGLEPSRAPVRTAGDKFEGIAFTFCKVAAVALIAERFTLPLAAFLSTTFYVLAYAKGKRDTRCWARIPLLIAGFWAFVGIVSTVLILKPEIEGELISRLHL